jgi:hypothetical protein
MIGDIVQDQQGGWFYRDNGDGTLDSLSDRGGESPAAASKAAIGDLTRPVVLVRDGQPTGDGDPLARRVAAVMARRYA